MEGDLSLTAGPTEAKAVWVGGPGSAHSSGGRGGMCWLSELGDPCVRRWMNQGEWEQCPFHYFAEKHFLE